MLHHYKDITERIAEPPKWYDENGTPRYCDFAPDEAANIYADEAALVEIACQNCGARFRVCMTAARYQTFQSDYMAYGCAVATAVRKGESAESVRPPDAERGRLAESIRDGSLHYGDPPNTGQCHSGPTMNCEDLRVLEYWVRYDKTMERDGMTLIDPASINWRRDVTLEMELPDAALIVATPRRSEAEATK